MKNAGHIEEAGADLPIMTKKGPLVRHTRYLRARLIPPPGEREQRGSHEAKPKSFLNH
jgi:hypothetical protein